MHAVAYDSYAFRLRHPYPLAARLYFVLPQLGPKALVVKTAKGAAVHVLTTESEEAENPTTPGTPAVAADVPPQSAVP